MIDNDGYELILVDEHGVPLPRADTTYTFSYTCTRCARIGRFRYERTDPLTCTACIERQKRRKSRAL